jgi:hypothetical protein
MQRWMLLVMVLLLPLRGWAGDLMGVHMATSGHATQASTAMPPGCPMHAGEQASAKGQSAEAHAAGAGMDGCSSCELCVPLAELPGGRLEAVRFAAHEPPQQFPVGFVSTVPAPAVKPPIA